VRGSQQTTEQSASQPTAPWSRSRAGRWRRDVIACMLMSAAHSISSAAAGAGAAWELATIHCRPPAAPSLVTTRPTQSRAPLSAAQKTSTLHCVSELQQ